MQSGTNVPYMKISAIDYSQNINGDYKATVTGGGEGIATLIPVLNGVHQAGLSTTIEFISAETRPMTGTVSVNSANLPTVKWSTKTGHRVRVFSSIDFPIRLVVTHHYIRAVLVRCNIQRYSPLLRELHR